MKKEEKINLILREMVRRILTDGKGKPLVRRGIYIIAVDEIMRLFGKPPKKLIR
jgi:hypothetical protein